MSNLFLGATLQFSSVKMATITMHFSNPLPQPFDEVQQLLLRMNPELVVDASNMGAHGILGDGEGPGHIGNASTSCDEPEHVGLAPGEMVFECQRFDALGKGGTGCFVCLKLHAVGTILARRIIH